ncbi:hypothetical protein LTR70_008697 [Exophiala xenobiotica]|uniref:Uncharacterized protein n=1 Tax=Lithohypha guttulata TaxID=1690604 RepID=A0ABR0K3I0_9EURO|nr:hypothetical protein LTR24_007213 [Lithohypha guttulata]KAK5311600.1 hypothetical protein LTR70_008697 [Exophiala xenobiotica]
MGNVGRALFDLDHERAAWEVVASSDGRTHFVMKPNKKLAPELYGRLYADVVVDGDKTTTTPSEGDAEAVLLHHMVNCNHYFSKSI